MMVRHADPSEAAAMMALYAQCFPDSDSFRTGVFTHVLPLGDTLIAQDADGKPAAMVLLPQFRLSDGQTVGYLYALCTRPDCRGQGHMAALLDAAHQVCAARGDIWTMLVPATAALAETYGRFGYAPISYLRESTVLAHAFPTVCPVLRQAVPADYPQIDRLWRTAGAHACLPRPMTLYHTLDLLYGPAGGGFYLCGGSYVFVDAEESVTIREAVACDGDLSSLLRAVPNHFGLAQVRCRLPSDSGRPYVYARGATSVPMRLNLLFD